MSFLRLPYRRETGPMNMAADWWMIRWARETGACLFRRYGWIHPQTSFGYGQKAQWVEEVTGEPLEQMVRRPTGGGIVRHQTDLTYALVLPDGSPIAEVSPMELYGLVHRILGEVLAHWGVASQLMPCRERSGGVIPGDCFLQPVGLDLMDGNGARKLAGAAIRRVRSGILLQGSLELEGFPDLDHREVEQGLAESLAREWGETLEDAEWPKDFENQRSPEAQRFSSLDWKKERKSA